MPESEKVFVSRKQFGKYTSTLEWCVKDGVWIDNCFKSTVTDRIGNIVEVIDRIRPIPQRVRPDSIVPPPIDGESPIAGTGKLWFFDPNYLSEGYIFFEPLKTSMAAWVIRVDEVDHIYDAETGKRIGRSKPPPTAPEDAAERFMGNELDKYRKGLKPIIGKTPAGAKFGGLPSNNVFPILGKKWFGIMGASGIVKSLSGAKEIISDNSIKYFHCLCHGAASASEAYTGSEVKEWMANRSPMWFALLDHCNVMSYTDEYSLSYAFRKGAMKGTVTIGLVSPNKPSYEWEGKLFSCVIDGETWGDAFDRACATFPFVTSYAFCGDRDMKLVGSGEVAPPVTPPPPEKSYIECTTRPKGASIWLKKY